MLGIISSIPLVSCASCHSSAVCTQKIYCAQGAVATVIVHIDPNICVTNESGQLCVIDYRQGRIRSLQMPFNVDKLWIVGNKLYVRGENTLRVLDV